MRAVADSVVQEGVRFTHENPNESGWISLTYFARYEADTPILRVVYIYAASGAVALAGLAKLVRAWNGDGSGPWKYTDGNNEFVKSGPPWGLSHVKKT